MNQQKRTREEYAALNAGIEYALAAGNVLEANAILQGTPVMDNPTTEERKRGLEALAVARSLFDRGLAVMSSVETRYSSNPAHPEILRARATVPTFRSHYDLLRQKLGSYNPQEEPKSQRKYGGKK